MPSMRSLSIRLAVLAGMAGIFTATLGVGSASAEIPAWSIRSTVAPTSLPPGGSGEIDIVATNLGDGNTDGSPITLSDKLPAGLKETSVHSRGMDACNVASSVVSCEGAGAILPYTQLELAISVSVGAAEPGAVNVASISGGGAQAVSSSEKVTFGSAQVAFGVEKLEAVALNEDGSPDTQAGSHPFQYTTTIQLNERLNENLITEGHEAGKFTRESSPAPAKDLHFDLPAGMVGNPTAIPQCTSEQFSTLLQAGTGVNECPADTAIGVTSVRLAALLEPEAETQTVPLFNLVPSVGEPARFGFEIIGIPVFLDTSVRSGGDYGVVVSINNISNVLQFLGAQVTVWGVPSDPRHDQSRGYECLEAGRLGEGLLGPCPERSVGQRSGAAFLTLPTSCTGPLKATVQADSWTEPGEYQQGEYTLHDSGGPLGLDGCNRLRFEPSVSVAPNGKAASTPTGLGVTEHISQEATLNSEDLAPAAIKSTTVTLPSGVQLSPSAGDGLQACSEEQIGYKGFNSGPALYEFTPGEPSCPEASKVATVRVKTPLLPHELTGAVYLAQQNSNPFGSLVALYIVARDPYSGVLVKAVGEVVLDPVTGQVTTTFPGDPQIPYEELELEFFGTARAPLTTPALCGQYTTQASYTPWSGNAPAPASSTFEINSGPNGAPCANPRPFEPGFESGTLNLQAGAFTPFELTMSRPDADQTLSKVETQLPPGLLGALSSVKLCEEPQAAQGTCGEESLIGHTTVSAGLGGDPYTVSGGKVFITGPYKGAPFGLSIVEPAVAGPFNLGTIVVRSQIRVDPLNSHLTVVSDALPTIIDGIPIQIQHVNVSVDRPGFVFNPTSCEPQKITGVLSSTEGATAGVGSPFQVTNCGSLAFKPGFKVSTSAKTSRTEGASLHVSLTLPAQAGQGTEANVARVKVELPRQLPARLTTLQKACLEKVFVANPASCPAASKVGEAHVSTPLLEGALSGPVYFVSHGGAKYPELIIVLTGENGVTVQVHGETFIHNGITSSTFPLVPDVPFTNFELVLPEGPYSALGTEAKLCKSKLTMPTEFVAQNGVVTKQSTKIAVTGCPKAVHKTKRKHRVKKKHKRKRA